MHKFWTTPLTCGLLWTQILTSLVESDTKLETLIPGQEMKGTGVLFRSNSSALTHECCIELPYAIRPRAAPSPITDLWSERGHALALPSGSQYYQTSQFG